LAPLLLCWDGGTMKKILKPLLILIMILGFGLFYFAGGKEHLSFENVKLELQRIQIYYSNYPFTVTGIFLVLYVLITSLSIPGAIVLTVLAGSIFGVALGTLIVATASTFGATMAFLMARFLFKEAVIRKYYKFHQKIDRRIKDEGAIYLFGLRLIPASPFVVINLVMGLTNMRLWTYIWITFIGMLPGTFIYVYAGRKFAELKSLSQIISWPIFISLLMLGLLPYLWQMARKSGFTKKLTS
jgi:uncharacterized membrane protein YdjX (TVP38/TMEM64 family)